jgi:glycosidase
MITPTPSSLRSTSIYQIFPRNYTSEGSLQAAARKLVEVAELGFDYVYLTPVHPVGEMKRKGSLGSPYAIADYRAVDPLLGGEEGLRTFIDEAHRLGLGVIMDVVYNHSSPDSVLARAHPEWFWKGAEGRPGPRIADWSDVADFDYSHEALWDYQIETLEKWARFGADGFRCDVASLVPVAFWVEARRRLAEVKPILWLAESVHKEFVVECRRRGLYAASDPELHAAFDLSYDYDGREELDGFWRGEKSLGDYLKMLEIQEALYPVDAVKLRFLENHDQGRAAARFGRGERLRNWTLFAMLLPGAFMAYMGEELAMERRIGLFEPEPMSAAEGDPAFRPFFTSSHELSRRIKREAPTFDARLLAAGVLLVERRGEKAGYLAILNLDGRSGRLRLAPEAARAIRLALEKGPPLRGAAPELAGDSLALGLEPVLLEA